MAIAVKVKGLDEYIAALTIAPAEIHKEIRIQFKEELEAIDLEAQHNHNYHTQSGILGRAIDHPDIDIRQHIWQNCKNLLPGRN